MRIKYSLTFLAVASVSFLSSCMLLEDLATLTIGKDEFPPISVTDNKEASQKYYEDNKNDIGKVAPIYTEIKADNLNTQFIESACANSNLPEELDEEASNIVRNFLDKDLSKLDELEDNPLFEDFQLDLNEIACGVKLDENGVAQKDDKGNLISSADTCKINFDYTEPGKVGVGIYFSSQEPIKAEVLKQAKDEINKQSDGKLALKETTLQQFIISVNKLSITALNLEENFYEDFSCQNAKELTAKMETLDQNREDASKLDKFIHELDFYVAVTTDKYYRHVPDGETPACASEEEKNNPLIECVTLSKDENGNALVKKDNKGEDVVDPLTGQKIPLNQWSKVIINDWVTQIEDAEAEGNSAKGVLFDVGDPARANFRKLAVKAEENIYFHIKMEMNKLADYENKEFYRVRDLLVPIYFNIMLKPLIVVDALEVDLDL